MIKIKSENKYLFSVLQKNPTYLNGIYPMNIKKGVALGIVDQKNNEYNIIFQDTKYSYSEDMSNQIDFQSFCNSRIILDILNVGFNSFLKPLEFFSTQKTPWLDTDKIGDIDIESECSLTFNAYIDSNWVNKEGGSLFEKYFEEINITHIRGYVYQITISGNMTLYRLLNIAALIAMFIAVINPQKWKITDDLIEKYIRILNNIGNVPYFFVYLFKVRLLYDNKTFEKYKPELEKVIGGNVHLTYGNTHDARLDYICGHIDGTTDVLDVGCGEFQYAKRILDRMDKDRKYYANDLEDWHIVAKAINKRYKATLIFSQDLDSLIKEINGNQVDIILTEVIEHNSKKDAEELIIKLFKELNIRKFILTTVNKDFNCHYELENETRHEDHKFEMHMDEFNDFFDNIINQLKNYNSEKFNYIQIGDSLAGECPTQGIYYEK